MRWWSTQTLEWDVEPPADADHALVGALLGVLSGIDRLQVEAVRLAGSVLHWGAAEKASGLSAQRLVELAAGWTGGDTRMLLGAAEQLPRLPVTMDAFAQGRLSWGQVRIVVAAARRLDAAGATPTPYALRGSTPLAVGSAADVIPAKLRAAVVLRDGGCRFPGCTAPPQWVDVHHLTWRSKGGATTEPNLACFCRRHHVLLHEGRWRAAMDADRVVTVTRGRWRFTSQPHIRGPSLT